MIEALNPPAPLSAHHTLRAFDCGEPVLDEWLRKRALANQASGASRTFVTADSTGRVMAYCALAAGAVSHQHASGGIRRNMPDPIPVLILGRLAVDKQAQGMRLGASLLQDAVMRASRIAMDAGVRALLVHAVSDSAARFYTHYGFVNSPLHPLTLMLRLQTG